MRLENGRPEVITGRAEKEVRVYDFLDKLNMAYWRVDHEPAFTMEVCREIDKTLGANTCKNLFLCNRQKTQFYLLMMPGDKVFKTKELSNQIGSARLSFGEAEYMEKFLELTPGAASVLGLMNDKENQVRLLVDEDVLKETFLGCHPCVNTATLKLRTEEVFGRILPAMGHDMTAVKLTGEE